MIEHAQQLVLAAHFLAERPRPAAEEDRGAEQREQEQRRVLGEEEHRPADARVLDEGTADDLGLTNRDVEGSAVELGQHRDVEDRERERLPHDVGDVALLLDNRMQVQRAADVVRQADHHRHRHQRDHERQLVGDALRRGTQRAQHRVAVVGAPAGHHPADDIDRRDGDDVEEPELQHADLPVKGKWDGNEDEEDRDKDEVGRELEDPRVGAPRPQILLAEQLERIGGGL